MCLITSNPYDFPLISMGVITVASIDDKAELDATDVSEPVFSSTNCHPRNVQNIYPVHFYCGVFAVEFEALHSSKGC